MAAVAQGLSNESIERLLGQLLRVGVAFSALIVGIGGAPFLCGHGGEPVELRTFHGEPATLRHPLGIVCSAIHGQSSAIIALGLLLLMATPIARVLFSAIAFAWRRDYTFVALTVFVLAILSFSLVG